MWPDLYLHRFDTFTPRLSQEEMDKRAAKSGLRKFKASYDRKNRNAKNKRIKAARRRNR